jgi:phage replication initiation protein
MGPTPGWEPEMYAFLLTLQRPRITRIDLARDFFVGEYSPDRALQDYEAELFSLGARMPEVEQHGNWIRPNGKGRTLQIGNRKSGKLARIYEKGLQLGRGFSELFPHWVRAEEELHNQDRDIPFDTLLHSGQYLAGSYPAFSFIHGQQTRIQTKKNTAKVTYDALVNTAKHQFGKLLYVMQEIEGTPEAVLERVTREGMPKRLSLVSMDYTQALPPLEEETISLDKAFALTFHSVLPGGSDAD